ncbi:MAG TPA: MBL fold metallo-hydrolase [Roseiflexaceae bacterium]|jgi:glyoxylase-like metal-dependent hydrolase (beta-lactamase superfamily II)
MPALIPIDDTITAIDHDLFGAPGIGVTYVVQGDLDRVALIETGTSLTAPATLAGLDQLGIAREAVRYIICTHIHMDHAGGAGPLAEALPNADVYINSATANFLVEPSRLLTSTRRAVGEALWPLQGTIHPLPSDRLRPAETLQLDLGRGVTLRAVASPGHSADHIAFFDERSGTLFAGDSCGIAMPRHGIDPRPVTPPPGFDLEAQIATYERLSKLPIERLLVTHCGPVAGGVAALREQHLRLLEAAHAVRAAVAHGDPDIPALAARLFPAGDQPVLRVWSEMSVAGLVRYFQKTQPTS